MRLHQPHTTPTPGGRPRVGIAHRDCSPSGKSNGEDACSGEDAQRCSAPIGLTAVVATAVAVAAITPSKPYAVGIAEGYETKPLLTVGDTVPETSNPAKQYQMVGIPDGLGAHKGEGQTTVALHEPRARLQRPVDGRRSASRATAARSSRGTSSTADGTSVSGERAYDEVYLENTLVGPAPTEANTTRSFARFCSASLAGQEGGLRHGDLLRQRGVRAVRAPSTASAASPSRSSTTRRTACRSSATSPGRTRSPSPTRERQAGRADGHGGRPLRPRPGELEQPGLPVRRHQGARERRAS